MLKSIVFAALHFLQDTYSPSFAMRMQEKPQTDPTMAHENNQEYGDYLMSLRKDTAAIEEVYYVATSKLGEEEVNFFSDFVQEINEELVSIVEPTTKIKDDKDLREQIGTVLEVDTEEHAILFKNTSDSPFWISIDDTDGEINQGIKKGDKLILEVRNNNLIYEKIQFFNEDYCIYDEQVV